MANFGPGPLGSGLAPLTRSAATDPVEPGQGFLYRLRPDVYFHAQQVYARMLGTCPGLARIRMMLLSAIIFYVNMRL